MKCKELTTSLVCYVPPNPDQDMPSPRITLVAHYEYGPADAGEVQLHAVRYTDPNGVPVDTSAGEVIAGPCVLNYRELVCVADGVEGFAPGQWTQVVAGQAQNTLLNNGEPQSITAEHSAVGSTTFNVIYSANGSIGATLGAGGNPSPLTTPSGQVTFSTPGGDFPVLLRVSSFSAAAAGTTAGLFGTPSISAISFSVRPSSVPPGVVEIADNVWGSPGLGLPMTEPFVFPAGTLNSTTTFAALVYRSTGNGFMSLTLQSTDPDAILNKREAYRQIDLDGTITLHDFATDELLTDVFVVPCGAPDQEQLSATVVQMCDDGVNFFRHFQYVDGLPVGFVDTNEEGEDYTPSNPTGVIAGNCCTTTRRERVRLCDLNPAGPVGAGNEICVTKFIRETTFNCLGEILSVEDFELDGTTPYTPVEVVDCDFCPRTTRQQKWTLVSRVRDPAYLDNRHWIYTLQNPFNPAVQGQVFVNVVSTGSGSGGCTPIQAIYSTNNRFEIVPDSVLLGADILRIHLDDLDLTERVSDISPAPTRIEGNAMWTGAELRGIVDNQTGYIVYEGVPPLASYRFRAGGCLALNFSVWSSVTYSCCEDVDCGCPEVQSVVLCDNGTPFLRQYQTLGGNPVGFRDTALDGETPYAVSSEANVGPCGGSSEGGGAPSNLAINRIQGASTDTLILANSAVSISATFFAAGFIGLLPGSGMLAVPAGFTWSVQGDPIATGVTIRGTDYIVTRITE